MRLYKNGKFIAIYFRAMGDWTFLMSRNDGGINHNFAQQHVFETEFHKALVTARKRDKRLPAVGWARISFNPGFQPDGVDALVRAINKHSDEA